MKKITGYIKIALGLIVGGLVLFFFWLRVPTIKFTAGSAHSSFYANGLSNDFVFQYVQQLDQILYNPNYFDLNVDVIYMAYIDSIEEIPVIEQLSPPIELRYVDGVQINSFYVPSRSSAHISQTEEFVTRDPSLRAFLSRACWGNTLDVSTVVQASFYAYSATLGIPVMDSIFASRVSVPCRTEIPKEREDDVKVNFAGAFLLKEAFVDGMESCIPYQKLMSKFNSNSIRCLKDFENRAMMSSSERSALELHSIVYDPLCDEVSKMLESLRSTCKQTNLFDEADGVRLQIEQMIIIIRSVSILAKRAMPSLKSIAERDLDSPIIRQSNQISAAIERRRVSEQRRLLEAIEVLEEVQRTISELGSLYLSQRSPDIVEIIEGSTEKGLFKRTAVMVMDLLRKQNRIPKMVEKDYYELDETHTETIVDKIEQDLRKCEDIRQMILWLKNEEKSLKKFIEYGGIIPSANYPAEVQARRASYRSLLYRLLRQPPPSPLKFPSPLESSSRLTTPWRNPSTANGRRDKTPIDTKSIKIKRHKLFKTTTTTSSELIRGAEWMFASPLHPYTSPLPFVAFVQRSMDRIGVKFAFPLSRRILEIVQRGHHISNPLEPPAVSSDMLYDQKSSAAHIELLDMPTSNWNERGASSIAKSAAVDRGGDLDGVGDKIPSANSMMMNGGTSTKYDSKSATEYYKMLSRIQRIVLSSKQQFGAHFDRDMAADPDEMMKAQEDRFDQVASFLKSEWINLTSYPYDPTLNEPVLLQLFVYIRQVELWLSRVTDSVLRLSPFMPELVLSYNSDEFADFDFKNPNFHPGKGPQILPYVISPDWQERAAGVADVIGAVKTSVESIASIQRQTDKYGECLSNHEQLFGNISDRSTWSWIWLGKKIKGDSANFINIASILEDEVLGSSEENSSGYLQDDSGILSEFAAEFKLIMKGIINDVIELSIRAFKAEGLSKEAMNLVLEEVGGGVFRGVDSTVVDIATMVLCPKTAFKMVNILTQWIFERQARATANGSTLDKANQQQEMFQRVRSSLDRQLDAEVKDDLLLAPECRAKKPSSVSIL